MDLAMFKPQQGAIIGYDPHPLISSHFFEDFIYVNFDSIDDIGCPELDWITYPDLKEVFKRFDTFVDDERNNIQVSVLEKPLLEIQRPWLLGISQGCFASFPLYLRTNRH